jgi:hypothetical protein
MCQEQSHVVLDAGDQSHGLRQSYGVARAAELQKRRCWVIKGVCDLADVKKDDAAHPTAAANAAEVLSTLISGGAFAYVDRRDLAMAGSDFFSKLPGGNDLLTLHSVTFRGRDQAQGLAAAVKDCDSR